uniref:Uncharacterized protein n=1 Tax=Sinocyclocheilus anshuiensis TaxID=1608454 RepID=A0A671MLZ6_9TELE
MIFFFFLLSAGKKKPPLKLPKEAFEKPQPAPTPPRDLDSKACVTIGDKVRFIVLSLIKKDLHLYIFILFHPIWFHFACISSTSVL